LPLKRSCEGEKVTIHAITSNAVRLRPQAGFFLPAHFDRVASVNVNPSLALDSAAIARCVKRIAREIVEHNDLGANLVLVGIMRRGATLAERLALALREDGKDEIRVGTLDISSYRDDGKGAPGDPRLLARDIPFALDGGRVILVDDVLYTGRTVRAALTALADLGRPESIQLAVLVDRGQRELPIRADFVGKNIAAPPSQRVYVRLSEIDGVDAVVVGGDKS
jgi:pyrimidine operon attenuation protein/uracil phosphoribosyltransferase